MVILNYKTGIPKYHSRNSITSKMQTHQSIPLPTTFNVEPESILLYCYHNYMQYSPHQTCQQPNMNKRQEHGIFYIGSGLQAREEIGLVNEIGVGAEGEGGRRHKFQWNPLYKDSLWKPEWVQTSTWKMRSNSSLSEFSPGSLIPLMIG